MIRLYFIKYTDVNQAKRIIIDRYSQDSDGKAYDIGYVNSGAPLLLFEGKQCGELSISHTDGLLAMAFSDNKIGVDIERKDRNISSKIGLSIAEWTRYEAYGKWLGIGICKNLLQTQLPKDLINTFTYGDYIVSICSELQNSLTVTNIDNVSI